MSKALLVLSAALIVTATGTAACGPGEHPPPGQESARTPADLQELAQAEVNARSDAERCTPWSSRPCRVYYTDARGQLHCPSSTEVCQPGGRGWFACGKYQLDDAGIPRLNDLEASQATAGRGPPEGADPDD